MNDVQSKGYKQVDRAEQNCDRKAAHKLTRFIEQDKKTSYIQIKQAYLQGQYGGTNSRLRVPNRRMKRSYIGYHATGTPNGSSHRT